MIYVVTDKTTGEEVARYSANGLYVDEWSLDQFSHVEIVEAPVVPDNRRFGGRRMLTKLEFIGLLGDSACATLLGMARQSVEIETFIKIVDWATPNAETGYSIDLDDPRMAQIILLEPALVAQGAVSSGWANEVLNG